jgi:hypothetical protein
MSGAFTPSLVAIFAFWAAACIGLAVIFVRRAPAVSVSLMGSIVGAIAGFLVGNSDGPAEVPAYTAVGASVGLFVVGILALPTTSPRGPSRALHHAGWLVLLVAPFAAAALTFLLQGACPLYISGKGSGFCNYQGVDVLGGWVSGVIVAFLVDAVFVAGLLFLCSWKAKRSGSRGSVNEDAPSAQPILPRR